MRISDWSSDVCSSDRLAAGWSLQIRQNDEGCGLPALGNHTAASCRPSGSQFVGPAAQLQALSRKPAGNPPRGAALKPRRKRVNFSYFSSTVAPASSSCFLTFSASSLFTPSLTAFGALSTSVFASVRPRPVIARISLITLIFLPPSPVRLTSNSVRAEERRVGQEFVSTFSSWLSQFDSQKNK